MAALTSLPSKVVRAIRFYLISTGVVDADHCYHQWDSRARAFNSQPIVDVMMRPVGPETQYTGNEVFIVEIQVKFQATEQPDQQAESARLAFDAMIGQVRQQMMMSDDGQSLLFVIKAINKAAYNITVPPGDNGIGDRLALTNADLNDFTMIELYQDVYGNAKSEEVNWAVVQRFKVVACETKIAGYA